MSPRIVARDCRQFDSQPSRAKTQPSRAEQSTQRKNIEFTTTYYHHHSPPHLTTSLHHHNPPPPLNIASHMGNAAEIISNSKSVKRIHIRDESFKEWVRIAFHSCIRAWKKFDIMYLDFAKEPRNVRLGLAADGFNPFCNLSQAYNRKGIESIDVASGQKFNMRAMVLWTINDFPARSSLSGWSGQGYKACPTCNKHTIYVHVLSKTAYVGHRRFLKKPHKLRSSLKFNGQTDNRDPPKEFGRDEILAQLDRLPTRVKGKHLSYEGVKIKRNAHSIKGVKLPDGFGSCFKHKVTDNDTNITGIKSHDCHIMMQRLLPYGLHQYLPDKIAKPIIELCSLFKQICSATLIEDDMLKAQIKVVDILCDLELIYPLTLFDIIIHLVIHLPLEALEGGPIRPRWMFPFKRYTKKLKGYVRNKAKLEGSIAEGYVAKEALLSVLITFGMLPRNLIIRQRNVDNNKDPQVSTTSELSALACGPTWTPISVNSCVVDGVRYVVYSRNERCTTQKRGICSPGLEEKMYYGQIQEILEFKYLLFKVMLFRVKWFDTHNQGRKVKRLVLRNNMTQIYCREDDPDIIHFDNSSDLPLSTSLNDLDNATFHIDGQSTEVDAPPDIFDVHDEDDGIIDDEDALPYDLADFDDEDLINVDDDGVDKMSVDVARSHDGDGGGEDRPPTPCTHRNIARAAQNRQNREKSTVISRQGSRSLARLRDEMRQSSATQEYPSLIDTFFVTHTVNGVFNRDEDRLIYEEIRRLEAMNTYTDDAINRLARRGKQRGHIPGVGRVLPARVTPAQFESVGASGNDGSGGCGDDEESADDQEDEDEDDDGDS
nr:hypothetical protein [Tanacetum cinerariifolium]